jgi:hypothetical protein
MTVPFHEWTLKRLSSAITALADFEEDLYPEGKTIIYLCLEALLEVDFSAEHVDEVLLVLKELEKLSQKENMSFVSARLREAINAFKKRA